ncbi:MAG: Grx4 family monothiol glutaredoxin [Deltaproteobacteria bacterium]|nr:Grx4 family monothiol glutaredoxin [Deltaproteobacteria bacterium]
MADAIQAKIEEQVKGNKIILYMKGTPSFPMCGFSAATIQVLDSYNVKYESVNVLDDPAIRDGVKRYSNWPTVPQLYINGEFVGGCDIVREMHAKGELEPLIRAVQA